jgi:hypothetical protein
MKGEREREENNNNKPKRVASRAEAKKGAWKRSLTKSMT